MKRSVLIAGAAFLALGGLAAASSRTSATAKQAAAPRVHTIRYAVHIGRPAGAGFQPRDLGQDNAIPMNHMVTLNLQGMAVVSLYTSYCRLVQETSDPAAAARIVGRQFSDADIAQKPYCAWPDQIGVGFRPGVSIRDPELGRETAALTKVLLSWQATLGTPTSWQQIAAQVQNHLISDWERALAQ